MYGFAKTLVCAYWDMYGIYTCRYFYFLFIGFDLENVAWPQWKWSLNWAWSLRGLVLGVFDQTKPACFFLKLFKSMVISLVIIPSRLPPLIKGTSTYQTASMRICHLLVTFYKCNDTFSLRGSFFKLLIS